MSNTTIRVLFEASNNVSAAINKITGDTRLLKNAATTASKEIDNLVAPVKTTYDLSPIIKQFEELEDKATETARVMASPLKGIKEDVVGVQEEFSSLIINSTAGIAGLSSPAVAFSSTLNRISRGLPSKAFEKFYKGIEKESKRALENAAGLSDIFRGVGDVAFPSIGGLLGFGNRESTADQISESLRDPFIKQIQDIESIPAIQTLLKQGAEPVSRMMAGQLATSGMLAPLANEFPALLKKFKLPSLGKVGGDLKEVGFEVGGQLLYDRLQPYVSSAVKDYFNIVELSLGKKLEKFTEKAIRSGFSAAPERRAALRDVEKYLTGGALSKFIESTSQDVSQRVLNQAGFRVGVPQVMNALLSFLPGLVPNLAVMSSLDAITPGLGAAFSTYGDDVIFRLFSSIPGLSPAANALASGFTKTKFSEMPGAAGLQAFYEGMDKRRDDTPRGKTMGAIADFGLRSQDWTPAEALGMLLDSVVGRNLATSLTQNVLENILGEVAITARDLLLPPSVKRIINVLQEKMPNAFESVSKAAATDLGAIFDNVRKIIKQRVDLTQNIGLRINRLQQRDKDLDADYLRGEIKTIGKRIADYKFGNIPQENAYKEYKELLTKKVPEAGAKYQQSLNASLDKQYSKIPQPTEGIFKKYDNFKKVYSAIFKDQIVETASQAINAVNKIRQGGGTDQDVKLAIAQASEAFAKQQTKLFFPKKFATPSAIRAVQLMAQRSIEYAVNNIPENVSFPGRGIGAGGDYGYDKFILQRTQQKLKDLTGETIGEKRQNIRREIGGLKKNRGENKRQAVAGIEQKIEALKQKELNLDEQFLSSEMRRVAGRIRQNRDAQSNLRRQYDEYKHNLMEVAPSKGLALQQRLFNSLQSEMGRVQNAPLNLAARLNDFYSKFEGAYRGKVVGYAARAIDAAKKIKSKGGDQLEIDQLIQSLSNDFAKEFKEGSIPFELRGAPGIKSLADMAKESIQFAVQNIPENIAKNQKEGQLFVDIQKDKARLKLIEQRLKAVRKTSQDGPDGLIEQRKIIQDEILRLSIQRNRVANQTDVETQRKIQELEDRYKNLDKYHQIEQDFRKRSIERERADIQKQITQHRREKSRIEKEQNQLRKDRSDILGQQLLRKDEVAILSAQLKRHSLPQDQREDIQQRLGRKPFSQKEQVDLIRRLGTGFESTEVIEGLVSRVQGVKLTDARRNALQGFAESGGTTKGAMAALLKRFRDDAKLTQEEITLINERIGLQLKRSRGDYTTASQEILNAVQHVVSAFPTVFKNLDVVNKFQSWNEQTNGALGEILAQTGRTLSYSLLKGTIGGLSEGFYPVIDAFDKQLLGMKQSLEDLPARYIEPAKAAGNFSLSLVKSTSALGQFIKVGGEIGKVAVELVNASQSIFFLQQGFDILFATLMNNPIANFVRMNSELEQQVIRIKASVLSTNRIVNALPTQAGFLEGEAGLAGLQKPTESAIAELRKRSLELATFTSADLIGPFGVVAGMMGGIGASMSDAVDLTISFASALSTLGIPAEQAAQEVRSILMGDITNDSLVARTLQISNTQVQSWRMQGTLVEKLQAKLSPLVAGQKEASMMLNGIISNTREFFQETGRLAAAPIFESIKAELQGVLDYITLNQKAIQEFANESFSIINDAFRQTNDKGKVVGGIIKPLRDLFGVFEGGAGNVVKFALTSIADIIDIFAKSISRTIEILKPFINLFMGLTGSLTTVGGPLIAMAIQFKTLQFGMSALGGSAGLLMRVLPGIGPLMQFLSFRTLPLINTFAFLTKNLGFNAAAFLTVGQNMRAIPGVSGQVNKFLGVLGPLAPTLTGIVPILSTLLIKSSGLAAVLKNLGGGLILGNLVKTLPNVVRGLGAVTGNKFFKGGGISGEIRKDLDGATDSLAKYVEAVLSAQSTNKAFAATTNTVFASFRGWILRTAALTAAIYGLVTVVNKFVFQNSALMDVVRGTASGFMEMASATKEFLTSGVSGFIIKVVAGFGAILFTMTRLVVIGGYLQHVFLQAASIISAKFAMLGVGLLKFADFAQGIPLFGKSMAEQARATALAGQNFTKSFQAFNLQKEAKAAKEYWKSLQAPGSMATDDQKKEASRKAIESAKAANKAYQDVLGTGVSERTLGQAIEARLKGIQQSFKSAASTPINQVKKLGAAIAKLPPPTVVWNAATQRASASVKAMGASIASGVAGIKNLAGQVAKAQTPTAAWGVIAQRTTAAIKAMGAAAQSAAAKMNIPFPIGQANQMGQSAQRGAGQINQMSGAAMRNGVAMKAMAKNLLGAIANITLMMASMAALTGLIAAASFAWYSWITMPKEMAALDEVQDAYATSIRSFDTLKGAIEWLREDSPKAIRVVVNAFAGLFDLIGKGLNIITLGGFGKLMDSIAKKTGFAAETLTVPSPSDKDYQLYDKLYKARERTEERTRNGIALTTEEYAENARLVSYFSSRIQQKEAQMEKAREIAAKSSNKDVKARAEAIALGYEVEVERFKKAIEGVATTQLELPMLGEYLDQLKIKAGLAWQAIQNPSGDPEIYKKQLDQVVGLNQKLYELGNIDADTAISKLAKVTRTEVQDTEGQVEAAYKAIFTIIDAEAAKIEGRLKTARQRIATFNATGKLSEIDKERELLKLQDEELNNREKALKQKIDYADDVGDIETVRRMNEEIANIQLQRQQIKAEGAFKLFELDLKRIKDQSDRAIDIIKAAQKRGLLDNQQAIERYTDEAVEGLRDRITRIQGELNSANYMGRSQREGLKRDMAVLNADIREAQNQAFEARSSDFEQDSQELVAIEEARMRSGEISELEFAKRREQIIVGSLSSQQRLASEHSRIIGSRDKEGQEAINAKRAELLKKRLDTIRETFEKELELTKRNTEQYLTLLENRYARGQLTEKRYIQQRLYAQLSGINEEQRVLSERARGASTNEERLRIKSDIQKLNIQRVELQNQYQDQQIELIKKGEDQRISLLRGKFAQNLSTERNFLESRVAEQRASIQASIQLSREYEQFFAGDPNRRAEARAQTAEFLNQRLEIERAYYEERVKLIESYAGIDLGILEGIVQTKESAIASRYEIEKKKLDELIRTREEQVDLAITDSERNKAKSELGKTLAEARKMEEDHNNKIIDLLNTRAANQIKIEEGRIQSIAEINEKRFKIELDSINKSLQQLTEYEQKIAVNDKDALERLNVQRAELLSKRREIERDHNNKIIDLLNTRAANQIKIEEGRTQSIAEINEKRFKIELDSINKSLQQLTEYEQKIAVNDKDALERLNVQRAELLSKRREIERAYYRQVGEMIVSNLENEKAMAELRITQGLQSERAYLKKVRDLSEQGIKDQIANLKQQLTLVSKSEIEERQRLNAEIAKLQKQKIDLIMQSLEQEIELVERNSKKASDIIATAQAEQELALYQGLVAREDIANKRFDSTQERIKSELKAESEKLRILRSSPPLSDPRAEESRQTRIRESIKKTAELRLESIKTEEERFKLMIDRQISALNNQVTATTQSFETQNQQLDLMTKAFEIQNKLLQAREALAGSLERLISSEYKFAEAMARTDQERSRIRQAAAQAAFSALNRQQEMAQRTLEIERKQAELAQVRAEWEQKIAEAKAVAGVAEAQAQLAKTKANKEATPEEVVAAQLGVEAALVQLAGTRASREILAAQRSATGEELDMKQRSLNIDQQAQRRDAQVELLNASSNPLIRQLLARQIQGTITPQQQQRLNQLMGQGAAISRQSMAVINQAESQLRNLPNVKPVGVPDINSIVSQLRTQFSVPDPKLPGQFTAGFATDENRSFFDSNVVNPIIEAIQGLGSLGNVTVNNSLTSQPGDNSADMIQRKTLGAIDSILKKTGRNLAI